MLTACLHEMSLPVRPLLLMLWAFFALRPACRMSMRIMPRSFSMYALGSPLLLQLMACEEAPIKQPQYKQLLEGSHMQQAAEAMGVSPTSPPACADSFSRSPAHPLSRPWSSKQAAEAERPSSGSSSWCGRSWQERAHGQSGLLQVLQQYGGVVIDAKWGHGCLPLLELCAQGKSIAELLQSGVLPVLFCRQVGRHRNRLNTSCM